MNTEKKNDECDKSNGSVLTPLVSSIPEAGNFNVTKRGPSEGYTSTFEDVPEAKRQRIQNASTSNIMSERDALIGMYGLPHRLDTFGNYQVRNLMTAQHNDHHYNLMRCVFLLIPIRIAILIL